jgi:hypothetical protein
MRKYYLTPIGLVSPKKYYGPRSGSICLVVFASTWLAIGSPHAIKRIALSVFAYWPVYLFFYCRPLSQNSILFACNGAITTLPMLAAFTASFSE